jgi:hypothetical protein
VVLLSPGIVDRVPPVLFEPLDEGSLEAAEVPLSRSLAGCLRRDEPLGVDAQVLEPLGKRRMRVGRARRGLEVLPQPAARILPVGYGGKEGGHWRERSRGR